MHSLLDILFQIKLQFLLVKEIFVQDGPIFIALLILMLMVNLYMVLQVPQQDQLQ